MARRKAAQDSAAESPVPSPAFDPAGEPNQVLAKEKARSAKQLDLGKPRSYEPALYLAACLIALDRHAEAEQVVGHLSQRDPGAFKRPGDWSPVSRAVGLLAWLLHRRGALSEAAAQAARIEAWGHFRAENCVIDPDQEAGALDQARGSIAGQSTPTGARNWRVTLARELCWVIVLRRARGLPVERYEAELQDDLVALRALLG